MLSRKILYLAASSFFSFALAAGGTSVPGGVISTCGHFLELLNSTDINPRIAHHDLPSCIILCFDISFAGTDFCSDPTKHRCAQHDSFTAALGEHDRHVARVGEELHERNIFGLAAGHIDRTDAVALGVHLVHDVSCLECDRLERDVEFTSEVAKPVILKAKSESDFLRVL